MADHFPCPDPRGQTPSEDEFESWCLHPVTRFVARAFNAAADQQFQAWTAASWGQGKSDPLLLTELRTRADAYMAFVETGLESYAKLIEEA